MTAVRIEQHGAPNTLSTGRYPLPYAGHGDVLVKVLATTVSRWDIKHRNGFHEPDVQAEWQRLLAEVETHQAEALLVACTALSPLINGNSKNFVIVDTAASLSRQSFKTSGDCAEKVKRKLKTVSKTIVRFSLKADIMAALSDIYVPDVPQKVPKQEARLGKIAADYLLAHPKVLVKISQKRHQQLHEREQLAMSLKPGDLVRDAVTPVSGPTGAKVAVIEFLDYGGITSAPFEQRVLLSQTVHH